MRYETQVRSVWADDRNVWRDSGGMTDSILRENEVLSVGCPVLLNSDTETEGGDLEHVTAIDVGGEERRFEWLIAFGAEAEFLAVGRNIGSAQHGPMRCRSLPLRSMLQNASSMPSNRTNTAREPSGVKDGSFSQPNSFGVNSTMWLPSAFMRAMLQKGASDLSISKTICRPSGDQSGPTASASKWVI
jgi:hypothetical protein